MVSGEQQHPLFAYLTQQEKNGVGDFTVEWNFNKFLINESGELMQYFPSAIEPLSEAILHHFE